MTDTETYAVHPDLAGNTYESTPTTAIPVAQVPTEIVDHQVVEDEAPLLAKPEQEEVYEAPQPQRQEDHPNFRSLREAARRDQERAERAERERDRLEAQLARNSQTGQNVQEQDEYINPEELMTGEQFTKVEKKRKAEQNAMLQQMDYKNQKLTEKILRLEFPDLREVLKDENVRRFAEENPEVAQGFSYIPDYEAKLLATYHAVKNSMKTQGVPMEDNYAKDRQRVQNNAAKPKPLNSISPQQGSSPLTRANVFANTDDSPASQLKRYEEMMKYAGNRQ